MAIVGRDFRFVNVNRMFCEMLGYTEGELLTRTFADITHPDHLDKDMAEIKKLYADGIARYRTEKRYIRKDGSEIWGSLTVTPLRTGKAVSSQHSLLSKILLNGNGPGNKWDGNQDGQDACKMPDLFAEMNGCTGIPITFTFRPPSL